jgi:uncharacterized iron-regulated protein
MKLQTKITKKDYKKPTQLIRYFDKRWLSLNELLDTPEGIEANLNKDVLWQRLRKGKCKTLEEFLAPKRAYKTSKERISDDLGYYPDEQKKKVLKIKGTFSIPKVYGKPLITKEILVDAEKYDQAKDKSYFREQLFAKAIADQFVIECVEV